MHRQLPSEFTAGIIDYKQHVKPQLINTGATYSNQSRVVAWVKSCCKELHLGHNLRQYGINNKFLRLGD